MNFFEKLLERKCNEENTRDYIVQWGVDKKLYQKISSGINRSYPSFTDHGITHSETILTNIERIFDEKALESLSSFDIWLLLESAYLHDCGMFISIEKIEGIIKDDSGKFIKYIQEILANETHELYKYAKNFKIENNNILFADNNYSPKIEFAMKYLLSFFKRQDHNSEFKDNINSNEKILQSRIYEVLYKICESHGKTFEETMTLSKKESGIKKEIGHPLFIACLLRIGDLLDIDNNRATNLILEELKNDIPNTSQYNLEKHRAITHYWVDSEKVEITATIRGKDTYNIAEITGNWFNAIEREFQNQNYNWREIKPEKFGAFLPKLGELGIEMDEYEYIDSKTKPKFSVNTNSILELLAGENIYKDKEKAIRELIQNSIDAIYLRVFEENKEEILKEGDTPDEKYFKDREIQIFIDKIDEDKEHDFYDIRVIDSGVGINRSQLKYILTSGSSFEDRKKQVLINEMPVWLQPSGNFGIGFQSVFMLTDKVILKSKSLYDNNAFEVELLKPTTKNNHGGEIYFKKQEFDYKQKIGTEIKFSCKLKKNRILRPINSDKKDFLIDSFKEENEEINKIKKEILDISEFSLIKIRLNNKILNEKSSIFDEINKKIYLNKFQILNLLNKGGAVENNILRGRTSGIIKFLYKNQKVEYMRIEDIVFGFTVNIIGEKAKDVVTVDRNQLKYSYLLNNDEILRGVLFEYCLNELPKVEEIKREALGYFYFVNKKSLEGKIESKIREEFEEYEKAFFNYKYFGEYSFQDILDKLNSNKELICIENDIFDEIASESESYKWSTIIRFLIKYEMNIEITYSLNEKNQDKWVIKKADENSETEIRMNGISYIKILDDWAKRRQNLENCNSRDLIINTGEFEKLRINILKVEKYGLTRIEIKKGLFEYLKSKRFDEEDVTNNNYLIFPLWYNFVEKKGVWNSELEEKYVEFVHQNQYIDKKYLKEDIRAETQRFIKYLRENNRIVE